MVTSRTVDEELDLYVHRRYPDIFEGTASEDDIALATQNDPQLSEYLGQVASAPGPEPQPDPSIASRVIDFLGDTGRQAGPLPAVRRGVEELSAIDPGQAGGTALRFLRDPLTAGGSAAWGAFDFLTEALGRGLGSGAIGGDESGIEPMLTEEALASEQPGRYARGLGELDPLHGIPSGIISRDGGPGINPYVAQALGMESPYGNFLSQLIQSWNYPDVNLGDVGPTIETFQKRPIEEQIIMGGLLDLGASGVAGLRGPARRAGGAAIDFLSDQGPAIKRGVQQGLVGPIMGGVAGGGPGVPRRGPSDPRFDDIVSRLGEAEATEAAELQRIQRTIEPGYPGPQADPDVPAFASDLFAKTGIRNVPIEQLPQDKLHYVLADPETGKASLEIVDNTPANREIHADLQLPRTDPQDPRRVVQSRLASPDLGSGALAEEFAGDLGVMGDTLENRALLAANRLNRGFTTVQTRGQTRTVQTPGSFREQGVIPYSTQMEGLQRLEEGRAARTDLPEAGDYYGNLSPEQRDLYDMYQQRDDLQQELREVGEGVVQRPTRKGERLAPGDWRVGEPYHDPATGRVVYKNWTADFSDEQLIAIARRWGKDPYAADWFASPDMKEVMSAFYTDVVQRVKGHTDKRTGKWVAEYDRTVRKPASISQILSGVPDVPLSSIPRSERAIRADINTAASRIKEIEDQGVSMPDLGEPTTGPRPYEGTGQQERLTPDAQPGPTMGPRPYAGTGTQEGLLSEGEMLRAEPPPAGAGGQVTYPPDTGAQQQYLPTDYGVSEASRLVDPVEEIPPYDISGIRGEAGAELGLDVSQALPEGYQVSGPPISQPRREFRFPRTEEEVWQPDPYIARKTALRVRRATDPEWQDYNNSKRGTEDFFSWKIRKAREAGELETQTGGVGGPGEPGGPGTGAGVPSGRPDSQPFTPQGLPGMPSGSAALGATVEGRRGIRQVVKAGTGEEFELDVLYQTDASRASASSRALGKKPVYGKTYSQKEAAEYERLAATSKISDEDRAKYLEWVNGKQPLTDEERIHRQFFFDQADFFNSRLGGVRSKSNPKRWEVTPAEAEADFVQFIAWSKGNAKFPAKYRMERLGEEMRDLRQGDIITEDDVRDMSPSLRNLYYDYIASEFKDLEANESIIKRWMNLRRTIESDVGKRVGGQKIWDDFTDWANSYGAERGFGSMTPQGDYWQDFLPSMQEHSVLDPAAGVTRNAFEVGLEVLATWRAIRSSYDLGWHLRQGAVIMANNPSAWVKSWGPTLKALGNEQTARAMEAQFYKYPIIQRALNPNLEEPLFVAQRGARKTGRETPAEEALRAEEYTSQWASKIPGIPMSERAFTVAGNTTRMQALIDITERWEGLMPGNPVSRVIDSIFGVGEDLRGAPIADDELQDLIRLVNYATGRGVFRLRVGTRGKGINIDWEGKAVVRLLNRVMFSPRFQIARWQAPFMIFSKHPRVRKEAARMQVRYWGFLMSVLGLFYAGSLVNKDIRVDVDRNSPNFGRVSWGRQTFDFTAGHQTWFRYLTQIAVGGNRPEGRTEMREIPRTQSAWRLWRSKGSPGAGEVYNNVFREDFTGKKIEYPTSVPGVISTGERIVNSGGPMTFVDILEGFELNTLQSWRAPITKFARMVTRGEDPDPRFAQNLGRRLRQGTTAGVAGVLGEGINTYTSVDDLLNEMDGIPYGGEIWPSDRYRALKELNNIEPPQGDYSQKVLDNRERLIDQIDQIVKNKVREVPVGEQDWRDVEPIDGKFRTLDHYVDAYFDAREIWRKLAREIAVDEFGPRQLADPETIEDPKERARAEYMQKVMSLKADSAADRELEKLVNSWDNETKMYVYSSQYLGSEDIVSPKMRKRLGSTTRGRSELKRIKKSEDARKLRGKMLVWTYEKERTQPGHIWSGGSRSPANRRAVE